jgi:hypothetical protein
MEEMLGGLYNRLIDSQNYIIGRFMDGEVPIQPAFEVFVKNPELKINEVMDSIKKATGLKVVRNELKRHTFIVAEWGPNDCHKCGQQMNSIQRESGMEYFCNQCVKFSKKE